MSIKCNKCGIADAATTHLCPPSGGGSAPVTFTVGATVTIPRPACFKCGKPAIGHWQPVQDFTATAAWMTGPWPLCGEHGPK